jgi:hypothetical protein
MQKKKIHKCNWLLINTIVPARVYKIIDYIIEAAFMGHHEERTRSNLRLLCECPLQYVEKVIVELSQPSVPRENKGNKQPH